MHFKSKPVPTIKTQFLNPAMPNTWIKSVIHISCANSSQDIEYFKLNFGSNFSENMVKQGVRNCRGSQDVFSTKTATAQLLQHHKF